MFNPCVTKAEGTLATRSILLPNLFVKTSFHNSLNATSDEAYNTDVSLPCHLGQTAPPLFWLHRLVPFVFQLERSTACLPTLAGDATIAAGMNRAGTNGST